ncbi:hypothetical protein JOM56_011162 [Amanita muscaria]
MTGGQRKTTNLSKHKEETAAQPEASSLINPNADDIELELLEEEAESDSEDASGGDDSDEEGDDLEYADY